MISDNFYRERRNMKYLQIILVLSLCINSLLFNTDFNINISSEDTITTASGVVDDITNQKHTAPGSSDNEKKGEEEDNLTRPDNSIFQEPKPNDSNNTSPQNELSVDPEEYPILVISSQAIINSIDRLPKISETYKRRIYYSKHRFDIG